MRRRPPESRPEATSSAISICWRRGVRARDINTPPPVNIAPTERGPKLPLGALRRSRTGSGTTSSGGTGSRTSAAGSAQGWPAAPSTQRCRRRDGASAARRRRTIGPSRRGHARAVGESRPRWRWPRGRDIPQRPGRPDQRREGSRLGAPLHRHHPNLDDLMGWRIRTATFASGSKTTKPEANRPTTAPRLKTRRALTPGPPTAPKPGPL